MTDAACRIHARRCLETAMTARSDRDKDMLIAIAEGWLDLAARKRAQGRDLRVRAAMERPSPTVH